MAHRPPPQQKGVAVMDPAMTILLWIGFSIFLFVMLHILAFMLLAIVAVEVSSSTAKPLSPLGHILERTAFDSPLKHLVEVLNLRRFDREILLCRARSYYLRKRSRIPNLVPSRLELTYLLEFDQEKEQFLISRYGREEMCWYIVRDADSSWDPV